MLRSVLAELARLSTAGRSKPAVSDSIDVYRSSLRKMANGSGKSDVHMTPAAEQAAVAVAELIRIAHSKVRIFGSPLPKDVFLSATVRAALAEFRVRNPHGSIVIVTSDPGVTDRVLAAFSDHPLDGAATMLPMPLELQKSTDWQFVLVDGPEAPSYWFNQYDRTNASPLRQGRVIFRDGDFGGKLGAMFAGAISHYGSLA